MVIMSNETLKDSVLTQNSENINFSRGNILISSLKRVTRTLAGTTTLTIVFDAGVPVTVNSINLANHNISSGVTTLEFQGNATDSWGAPSVDETLTRVAGIISKQFTGGSFRYWRINIIDAGNTDTFIQLGRVSGCDALTPPSIAPEVSRSYKSDTVKVRSNAGNSFGNIYPKYRTISIQWKKLTVAEVAELEAFFDQVDSSIPFFVFFDETDINIVMYVTIDGDGIHTAYLRKSTFQKGAIAFIEEL
jgi:hypothetical protein